MLSDGPAIATGPDFLEAGAQEIGQEIGTATVYFVLLGLPTGNAGNLLPTMYSIVLMKTSFPQGRPVFVF
ncbi:MAG: hypothetical protein NTY00_03150 [Deltaproteobacteria bacterium]|nr:hypothetical protein [Deltaproteobacteria bacterium]